MKKLNYHTPRSNSILTLILNLILIGSPAASVFGQETELDSLRSLISNAPNENERLDQLWAAAYFASNEDVEAVYEFTGALMESPSVKKDSAAYYDALRLQADANRWTGHYVKAIEEFDLCYLYFKSHSDTTKLIFCADHLGSMNMFMGYNEQAQNYLLEVYDLELERGNNVDIAGALNGLAIFYDYTGQPDKAIERYQEALQRYIEADDLMGQANVSGNMGLTLIEMERFDEAEMYLKKQAQLDTLLGSTRGLGFHFDFMGYFYDKQGMAQEAYENYYKALKIRETLPSKYNVNESRASVAEALLKLDRFDEAIAIAEGILETSDITNSLTHQQRAYDVISQSHEALGNPKVALRYHKLYKEISDSILNAEILEKVTENDAKFELVEQRAKNEVLNAENKASQAIIEQKSQMILLYIIGLSILGVLVIMLYLLARKYLRQKDSLAQALQDKDTLLREIHHRVKNNLQVVSSLLSLQGRSIDDEAAMQAINEGKSRVRTMALIHHDLYQHDNLTGVNVKDYLIKLCRELFETYKISDERVNLSLDISVNDVDVDTLVPLGLIINELITNSLKYAFPDGRSGTLTVRLFEEAGKLMLIVSDNGVGYDPENVRKNSFGRKLIDSLSRQLKAEVETSTSGGTSVQVTISKYKISR